MQRLWRFVAYNQSGRSFIIEESPYSTDDAKKDIKVNFGIDPKPDGKKIKLKNNTHYGTGGYRYDYRTPARAFTPNFNIEKIEITQNIPEHGITVI